MIKLTILVLSFGLSALLTFLLHFNEAWQIAAGIVGFGLAFVVFFCALVLFIVWLFGLKVRKNENPVKYSKAYRKLFNICQYLLLSLFSVKLTVNGLDKVPTNSSFVLLQNHLSNVDPIFTDYVLRKTPMIFVSKESLFKLPFFGKVIRHIGYVKLTRKIGVEDAKEIIRGITWVKHEECSLGVYPEGTRNKNFPEPLLLDFKEESLAIAKRIEKPIVISVIHGSDKINDKLLLKVHKIQIDIVGVLKPEDYANLTDKELADKTRNIMLESIQNPSKNKEKVRLY